MRMLGHWSTLADTLTEAATETPGDTLVDLEAEALVDTASDTLQLSSADHSITSRYLFS